MTAVERVEFSRERLRRALLPSAESTPETRRNRLSSLGGAANLPFVGIVIESLKEWWSHHALRPAAQIVAEASRAVLMPLAHHHPFVLVLSASGAGAALAWSRPWRWIFSSALLAGLLPQLASRVVARLPLETWVTMLGTALSRPGLNRSGKPTTKVQR
ncbi:MAG: hypothetical protein ABI887_00445 [Burkholderiales bacterium]